MAKKPKYYRITHTIIHAWLHGFIPSEARDLLPTLLPWKPDPSLRSE